jgi:hypothetical protein
VEAKFFPGTVSPNSVEVVAVRKLLPTAGLDPERHAACFGRKSKKRVEQITAITRHPQSSGTPHLMSHTTAGLKTQAKRNTQRTDLTLDGSSRKFRLGFFLLLEFARHRRHIPVLFSHGNKPCRPLSATYH